MVSDLYTYWVTCFSLRPKSETETKKTGQNLTSAKYEVMLNLSMRPKFVTEFGLWLNLISAILS